MTKFIGLIGYPLLHSISPYFQQAALDYYQLDIEYRVWETTPEKLGEIISTLRQPQNLGANVTVPYKEAVLPLLDEADELANLIGAVNTIAKRDDRLVGFNTDVHGFLEALRKEGNFDPEGKVIAILGAGGVARAVSFALVQQKASELNIFNRSFERSERLANNLRGYIDKARLKTEIFALPWRNMARRQTFDHCQLIVNCTTIGMKYSSQEGQSPLTMEAIPADILVYDLVYNPWPTPLLKLAQKAGANILSGLPMLVYQGAASFKLWTAREAPLNIMFGKAEEVLKR